MRFPWSFSSPHATSWIRWFEFVLFASPWLKLRASLWDFGVFHSFYHFFTIVSVLPYSLVIPEGIQSPGGSSVSYLWDFVFRRLFRTTVISEEILICSHSPSYSRLSQSFKYKNRIHSYKYRQDNIKYKNRFSFHHYILLEPFTSYVCAPFLSRQKV